MAKQLYFYGMFFGIYSDAAVNPVNAAYE